MPGRPESLQREFLLKLLQPGDLLLYRTNDIVGRAIQLKTYSKVTHCEIYVGSGRTIASRNGIGVNTYDFDPNRLAAILRPTEPVDILSMMMWHVREAKGQAYDWVGLFLGFIARKWGRENKRMWCSEHTTRAYRRGNLDPFRDGVDADSIAPGDLFKSAKFKLRWMSPALRKALGRDVENSAADTAGDSAARYRVLEEAEDAALGGARSGT